MSLQTSLMTKTNLEYDNTDPVKPQIIQFDREKSDKELEDMP